MTYPREVLNKVMWTGGLGIGDVVIWYVHRGAPGDVMRLDGAHVRRLDRWFFETDEASIPYHRVLRIDRGGETLFLRNEDAKELS